EENKKLEADKKQDLDFLALMRPPTLPTLDNKGHLIEAKKNLDHTLTGYANNTHYNDHYSMISEKDPPTILLHDMVLNLETKLNTLEYKYGYNQRRLNDNHGLINKITANGEMNSQQKAKELHDVLTSVDKLVEQEKAKMDQANKAKKQVKEDDDDHEGESPAR